MVLTRATHDQHGLGDAPQCGNVPATTNKGQTASNVKHIAITSVVSMCSVYRQVAICRVPIFAWLPSRRTCSTEDGRQSVSQLLVPSRSETTTSVPSILGRLVPRNGLSRLDYSLVDSSVYKNRIAILNGARLAFIDICLLAFFQHCPSNDRRPSSSTT